MSSQAVNQFLEKVSEDAQLQQEIKNVMSSAKDAQPLVEIGAKHGYEFTSEEIKKEIKNLQQAAAATESGELNEDELEAVAGGKISGKTVLKILNIGANIFGGIASLW